MPDTMICDMHRAGGLPHQEDFGRIAATLADLCSYPLYYGGEVFGGGRPDELRRQPVGGVDADKAILHRPQHDVVVERAAGITLVARDKAAAVDEDQYRPRR